jgi:hypothetical protein
MDTPLLLLSPPVDSLPVGLWHIHRDPYYRQRAQLLQEFPHGASHMLILPERLC